MDFRLLIEGLAEKGFEKFKALTFDERRKKIEQCKQEESSKEDFSIFFQKKDFGDFPEINGQTIKKIELKRDESGKINGIDFYLRKQQDIPSIKWIDGKIIVTSFGDLKKSKNKIYLLPDFYADEEEVATDLE